MTVLALGLVTAAVMILAATCGQVTATEAMPLSLLVAVLLAGGVVAWLRAVRV